MKKVIYYIFTFLIRAGSDSSVLFVALNSHLVISGTLKISRIDPLLCASLNLTRFCFNKFNEELSNIG